MAPHRGGIWELETLCPWTSLKPPRASKSAEKHSKARCFPLRGAWTASQKQIPGPSTSWTRCHPRNVDTPTPGQKLQMAAFVASLGVLQVLTGHTVIAEDLLRCTASLAMPPRGRSSFGLGCWASAHRSRNGSARPHEKRRPLRRLKDLRACGRKRLKKKLRVAHDSTSAASGASATNSPAASPQVSIWPHRPFWAVLWCAKCRCSRPGKASACGSLQIWLAHLWNQGLLQLPGACLELHRRP